MELKKYLLETFDFNDITNIGLLEKIGLLANQEEAISMFSHLVNSQYKWMARILQDPQAVRMSWWEPTYPFHELETQWTKSLEPWKELIRSKTDEELETEISFAGFDGSQWFATIKDIALQLNYHSIHHRAQIQTIIRKAGYEPDFVDYIRLKYRKVDA